MQDAIIEAIRDYKLANDGNSPTYREIATTVGSNSADVYRFIAVLERRGLVRINEQRRLCLVGGFYTLPD